MVDSKVLDGRARGARARGLTWKMTVGVGMGLAAVCGMAGCDGPKAGTKPVTAQAADSEEAGADAQPKARVISEFEARTSRRFEREIDGDRIVRQMGAPTMWTNWFLHSFNKEGRVTVRLEEAGSPDAALVLRSIDGMPSGELGIQNLPVKEGALVRLRWTYATRGPKEATPYAALLGHRASWELVEPPGDGAEAVPVTAEKRPPSYLMYVPHSEGWKEASMTVRYFGKHPIVLTFSANRASNVTETAELRVKSWRLEELR